MLKIIIALYLAINMVAVPVSQVSKTMGVPLIAAKTASNFVVGGTLYLAFPEALGVVEHISGFDLIGTGRCRIDNVREAEGNAVFIIGNFTLNGSSPRMHIRAFKKDRLIEYTCKDCIAEKIDAVINVKEYKISSAVIHENSQDTERNIRYLRGALFADKILKEANLI